MTSAKRIFVDTNVLIRATVDAAPLHLQARILLDKLWDDGAELYISHQVVREYIANTTRPQSYSPALPMDKILAQVEDFRKSFHILSDSRAVLSGLLELLRKVAIGGKQIHDANLVATMLVNEIDTLLTNNVTDFERYYAYIQVLRLE